MPNPIQISQLGSEKLQPDDTDLIPIQQADGITRHISKENLFANYAPISQAPSGSQYIHLQHTVASGQGSGGKQSVQWTARPINTIKFDQTGLALLSNNTITLPAGIYVCDAVGQFYDCGLIKTRLQDVTNDATLGRGYFTYTNWGSMMYLIPLKAIFTLAQSTDIQLQYFQAGGNYDGTYNMGAPWSYPGVPEVFADIILAKIG
ncbi:hypothetical protein [Nostoc punctiforme]|uniref:Uncharacterized protein n=1 Tax=Nostoc punctiforme (strain ATCC 29133 / PCC 73102) TaxID=63737 RepID=B2J1H8_NOSP7|nr:hypothetical protein [Nostoc punctiforme]ACC80339.1 hypothetical protein Npun_F1667 [Nostoc punctiforme PCC 73102]